MSDRLSRREFLQRSSAMAIGLGLSSPAWARILGANDRIHIGVIGCGGRGTDLMRQVLEMGQGGIQNVQVTAVCDIYEPRKQQAGQLSGAPIFHDYRKLLEQKNVDAVIIATPDHWHARMALDALEAGKDVYLEKPMTLYWHEAKEVAQKVKETGRVLQVGAQSCSEQRWRKAQELIQSHKLGKVLWARSSFCRNSREGEWNWGIDPDCSPQNLDWKAFLGPAPNRPFNPERYFRFRKFWDYSGGIATDLFYHQLSHLMIALGPEFPTRVVAGGGIYVFHDREVPDTFHMIVDYPSGYSVVLVSSMGNRQGITEVIHGHEATLYFEGGQLVIRPEDEFKNERQEIRIEAPGGDDHLRNFLECMRTRAKPNLDAETGYKIMVAIALGVESYRKNKVMRFDPQKEEVVRS